MKNHVYAKKLDVIGKEIDWLKSVNVELLAACRAALWIQDKLIEQAKWGASFEEWEVIRAAIAKAEAPNP